MARNMPFLCHVPGASRETLRVAGLENFMRVSTKTAYVPLLGLIVACGGTGGSELSDDLRKDLEASASKIELAGQDNAYKPMRFVSELEQGKVAEPVQRQRAPRRVAANTAAQVPEETTSPAPEALEQVQVAVATEAPHSSEPAAAVSSVPRVAPRPVSLPVDVPASSGRGDGRVGAGRGDDGIGIGDVIGVVIRGGGVGPDHCPPPRGRRPRGPWGRFP